MANNNTCILYKDMLLSINSNNILSIKINLRKTKKKINKEKIGKMKEDKKIKNCKKTTIFITHLPYFFTSSSFDKNILLSE